MAGQKQFQRRVLGKKRHPIGTVKRVGRIRLLKFKKMPPYAACKAFRLCPKAVIFLFKKLIINPHHLPQARIGPGIHPFSLHAVHVLSHLGGAEKDGIF